MSYNHHEATPSYRQIGICHKDKDRDETEENFKEEHIHEHRQDVHICLHIVQTNMQKR